MNRRILFAILAVGSLALVATGCEKKENKSDDTTTTTTTAEKTLTCEMDEEDDGVKENSKYSFSWNGDKMEKIDLSMSFTYKDKYDEKSSKIAKYAGVDEVKDLAYDQVKSTLEKATFTCK